MKPQTSGLVVGKLKHKVLREPVGVALNGKIQGFGGNAIQFGEVCIEHDLLAADQQYSPLDLNRQGVGEFLFFSHFCRQTLTKTVSEERRSRGKPLMFDLRRLMFDVKGKEGGSATRKSTS